MKCNLDGDRRKKWLTLLGGLATNGTDFHKYFEQR